MIKTTEQALFCLSSPDVDEGKQMNHCKNCRYSEMCSRVVAIITEYKELWKQEEEEEEKTP